MTDRMDYTKAGGKSWRTGTLTHKNQFSLKQEQGAYNGWENYETWNVALYIGNDWDLYLLALDCKDYEEFKANINAGRPFGPPPNPTCVAITPDGVRWSDPKVNVDEINLMLQELT